MYELERLSAGLVTELLLPVAVAGVSLTGSGLYICELVDEAAELLLSTADGIIAGWLAALVGELGALLNFTDEGVVTADLEFSVVAT